MIGKYAPWLLSAFGLACLCPLPARGEEPTAKVQSVSFVAVPVANAAVANEAARTDVASTTAAARPADPSPIDLGILLDQHMLVLRLRVRYNDAPFVQMWQQFAESKFDSADKDHNGLLDAEEFITVKPLLPPAEGSGNNRNGQFIARRRGVPSPLPIVDPADETNAGRELMPEVTRQEFVDYLRATANGPVRTEASYLPSAASRALFRRLDTDHDDKLSPSECERAFDTLHPLDLDEADLFTPNQLVTGTAGANGNAYFVQGDNQQRATPVRLAMKPLRFSSPASLQAWVDRIRQHFAADPKTSIPRSLRGTVTLYDEATRAAIDADGDGNLDQAELAHLEWRPIPNLELTVDEGREKPSMPALPGLAALSSPARVRNRGMMQQQAPEGKIEPTGVCLDRTYQFEPAIDDRGFNRPATLTMGGEQIEMVADGFVAANAQQQGVQLVNNLKQFDRDKNDYLEEKELRQFGPNNNFMVLDTNGDGKLYFSEIEEYVNAQSTAAAVRLVVTVVDHDHAMFESLDTDRDGRLARRELAQLASQAAAWDRDGDGQLAFDEIPRLYTVRVAQDQPQLPFQRFFGVNLAFAPRNRRSSERGPDWFTQMDRNADGDISRREFLGTTAQFRVLDSDGDQLIDRREAEGASPTAEDPAGEKSAGEPATADKTAPANGSQ
ncbi:MAG TPA: hypothetical protein VHY91_18135 [Pirellulales bacterium]|nr:hypothetical protein [Pirellulales bacterium]